MKCGHCGTNVKGKPSLGGVRSAIDFASQMAGTGYFCPACNKGFCSKCSMEAAKKAGKGGYTCPNCHSLIGDNPWG